MRVLKSGAVVFYVLTWLLAGIMLAGFFHLWWVQRADSTQQSTYSQVILNANRANHYIAMGKINGNEVRFLVDTGATTVSIPNTIAQRLALERNQPLQATTASGVIVVYSTTLKSLEIGPIKLTNVKANINPQMPENYVLLGMSALKSLDIELRQNKLILSQPVPQ